MSNNNRRSWDAWLDAPELETTTRVGQLFQNLARTSVPATFAYDPAWLQSATKFALDPRLDLYAGEQTPEVNFPAFGIFMDSAPDRWGRVLMERRELLDAEKQNRDARTLQETDFLLGVSDEVRMGALRFREAFDQPFVAHDELSAPPVTSLHELAAIARRIEEPGSEKLLEYEKWLAMLIAPGSSLGGARPKANFRQADGTLWIAKFPAKEDRYDVGAWELVTRELARRCGIQVPDATMAALASDHHTYCAKRFDRRAGGQARRMYCSAMTLLERRDGMDGASYLDLVQTIEDHGAQSHVASDLEQLFRRVVFNVLIGNRDDHLRNHGFLREPTGWRLSQAFDMNPSTAKSEHALTLDGVSREPDIQRVLNTAEYYRLTAAEANRILAHIRKELAQWREVAQAHQRSSLEIKRMTAVIQT
jgi:serine/threonine-protein kinase HipA